MCASLCTALRGRAMERCSVLRFRCLCLAPARPLPLVRLWLLTPLHSSALPPQASLRLFHTLSPFQPFRVVLARLQDEDADKRGGLHGIGAGQVTKGKQHIIARVRGVGGGCRREGGQCCQA